MGIDDRDYMRERHRNLFSKGKPKPRSRLGEVFFNYSTGKWDHEESLNRQRERITGIRHRRSSSPAALSQWHPSATAPVV